MVYSIFIELIVLYRLYFINYFINNEVLMPLEIAIIKNNTDIVRLLLSRKDINIAKEII